MEDFRRFSNVPLGSRIFEKVQDGSRSFQMFQKIMQGSRSLIKFGREGLQKVLEGSVTAFKMIFEFLQLIF